MAHFHNVRRVALDLELGIDIVDTKPKQPILDCTSAKELFSYISARKEGVHLEYLTLVVGEKGRRVIPWAPWWRVCEIKQAASFEMRHGGRGEMGELIIDHSFTFASW